MREIALTLYNTRFHLFFLFFLGACQGGAPSEVPAVEPHQENWAVFLREAESRPSIITIDLGWAGVAPLKHHNKLLMVTVETEGEQLSGLPSEEEIVIANRLQDQLIRSLEKSGQGIFVGSSTSFGQKNFFFYLNDSSDSERIANKVLVGFKSRKAGLEVRRDYEWAGYFDVLYPDDREQNKIMNQRVLSNLQEAGDPLREPRPIDHWLRFSSMTQCDSFLNEVRADGFRFQEMNRQSGGSARPFVLHIIREDSIHIPYIHELTWMLREKAEAYDGVYDGWETIVARR